MEVSSVFQKMFTVNFKEKDAKQIELPDKDPTTFALFLRHTLPGFDGLELQESEARLILPLAHEYQTDTTLSKIDEVLAACVEQREYKCDKKLTDEILTAEFYNLKQYVTACIEKTSEFSHKAFTKNPKFRDVSGDTRSEIFLHLCKEMEIKVDQCIQELEDNTKNDCRYCTNIRRFCEASDKLKSIRKAKGPRLYVLK